MTTGLPLLGAGGSQLSPVANTLKVLGDGCEHAILENLRIGDRVPFNCGFCHRRIWSEPDELLAGGEFILAVGATLAKRAVFDFSSDSPRWRAQDLSILRVRPRDADQHRWRERRAQ